MRLPAGLEATAVPVDPYRFRLSRRRRLFYDFQHAKTMSERIRLAGVYAKKAFVLSTLWFFGALLFNPIMLRLWVWVLRGRVEFFGNSASIGYMAAITYYLKRKLHHKSRVLSIYLVNKPLIANIYLARFQAQAFKGMRVVFVFNRFLCQLLEPLENRLFYAGPRGAYSHHPHHPAEYHTLNALYDFHLERKLPQLERRRARVLMAQVGLPPDAKFVCIHAREPGFKIDWHPHGHDPLRDADIMTYLPAIEYLTSQEFWVVRMGESTVKSLPPMPHVIDYARTGLKCDFLDIVLIAECEFYVGCSSGLAQVAHMFNKPYLWTNAVPLESCPWSEFGFWIPKLIFSQREGRYLTYPEIVSRGIGKFSRMRDHIAAGLEVHANSAEDILEAVKELHRWYEGDPGYSEGEIREQRNFPAIFPEDYMSYGTQSRICVSFIKKYRHLMSGDPATRQTKALEHASSLVMMNRFTTLPRPYPDKELYHATIEAGLRVFPKRRENYLKYQAAKRGEVVDYLPIQLDIENVSRCNYHCTMCQVSDWPGLKRANDMTFEDYKALIDRQHGLIEIKLQGMGEPLLGQCYFEMIEYVRARHIWVRSTTNGSLLHLNENYKRVIDADICELQVSIDGATQETYEKIRRGGRFDKVMDNCLLLNRYCRDVDRTRTRMWTVVQKDNFHELERFPALAAELGFERLTLSLDLNDWGQDRWRQINDQADVHRIVDELLARHLIDLGKVRGVEVTYWFIDEKYDATDPAKLCPWPFERAYISSDMRIVPCCMIANPEIVDLGDARNLTSEWNNNKMVAFRKLHLNGNIPQVCQSCYKQARRLSPEWGEAAPVSVAAAELASEQRGSQR